MIKRRKFTPEQKAQIVLELLKEHKSLSELAAEYEIHPRQLQRWRSEAIEKIHLIFTKASDEVEKLQKKPESEVEDLTKQIGQLSIEVNWLKKIWLQVKITPSMLLWLKKPMPKSQLRGRQICFPSTAPTKFGV